MFSNSLFPRILFPVVLAASVLFVSYAFAQSTGTIQGTIVDSTGAAMPNASVTVRNESTGEERVTATDSAGIYVVPSLAVGSYSVSVKASGMQLMEAPHVQLSVGSAIRQDFTAKIAATTETIEVVAATSVVDSTTVSVGSVVNQITVQEIPLNGRHFVDLALLTPGTVTPPANGFLTAPLRGQGSFSRSTELISATRTRTRSPFSRRLTRSKSSRSTTPLSALNMGATRARS
jgi:hypothetical protein